MCHCPALLVPVFCKFLCHLVFLVGFLLVFLSMISLQEAKALMKLRFSNRAPSPPTSRKTTNDRPVSHRKTTNDSSGRFELLVRHYLTTWIVFNKVGFSTNEIWCVFLCLGLVAILGPLKAERPNDQINFVQWIYDYHWCHSFAPLMFSVCDGLSAKCHQ